MISEAQVKMVKYPPELLPDSWYGLVPLNGEAAPPILDLRNFKPYVVSLTGVQFTVPTINVNLRARYDTNRVEESTVAVLTAMPGAWQLPAIDNLYYNLFGLAATANFRTYYGLWVTKPNIAQKMLYGITLDPSERALADSLGIADTVDKGLLPLPIREQIEREYIVTAEETHSRQINIAIANAIYEIEHIYPRPGEIIVLTRIASAPAAVGDIVRIVIDRDRDVGIANIMAFPLSLILGGEIACFIPATTEIRLTCQATVPPGLHALRYTFQRIKLTNILRARFGLVVRGEIPGDTYDKVTAGVL